MKSVSVGQIYVESGASFPFSYRMQNWLSTELTPIAQGCLAFDKKYGPHWSLMIRISAKTILSQNDIRGPAVFAKDEDVEYTVFLPFRAIAVRQDSRLAVSEFLIQGIENVFLRVGIEPERLRKESPRLIKYLASDSTILKEPWPISLMD